MYILNTDALDKRVNGTPAIQFCQCGAKAYFHTNMSHLEFLVRFLCHLALRHGEDIPADWKELLDSDPNEIASLLFTLFGFTSGKIVSMLVKDGLAVKVRGE